MTDREVLQQILEWSKLKVTDNVPVSPAALRAIKFQIERHLWPQQERKNDD